MINEVLAEKIRAAGVVAVVTIDSEQNAIPLAESLLAGGIRAIELTLRTPVALDCLKRIRVELPEMMVGAGTVISPDQVQAVVDCDAHFAVAPGLNPAVVGEAARLELPFAPGVCTPSDIEAAVALGCRVLKFFPAEPSGGLAYLRSMFAPYAHLGIQFIPLGGITQSSLSDYVSDPSVIAVGGSWLAPTAAIRSADWDGIVERSVLAREIVDSAHEIVDGARSAES